MTTDLKHKLGLEDGQRHPSHVSGTRGAGWYNERGEWLGWGDLTNPELEAIAAHLLHGERFIVLHSEDSYRRFLRNIVPDLSRVFRNEDAPGIDYVAEHAILIVETGVISSISRVMRTTLEQKGGLTYQIIGKDAAEKKILGMSLDEWRSNAKAFSGMQLESQC